MSLLAFKKLDAERAAVMAARLGMEAKIEELRENIQRMERDCGLQKNREDELTLQLEKMKEEKANG